jgi:hypothetical protein
MCNKFPGLSLSVMTTSCYTGPWATIEQINAITVSGEAESNSWYQSETGRFNGSPFSSCFTHVLADQGEVDEVEEANFEEFAELMRVQLCQTTLASSAHDFQFNTKE